MENYNNYFINLQKAITDLDENILISIGNKIIQTAKNRKKIYICGNGGSAANASHITNDFIFPVGKKRGFGLPFISLTDNVSSITCISNDTNYDFIFKTQLESLANQGDMLICLSGSGNSKNIIEALNYANNNDIFTFSVLGQGGGEASKITDQKLIINSNDMQVCEDCQIIIFHYIMKWASQNLNT